MDLSEWYAVEARIDASQVPDGPALIDLLPRDYVESLSPLEALALAYDPRATLRPRQMPPTDADWLTWVLVCGRSWGKTHAAASWLVTEILANTPDEPADYLLVAPTEELCRKLQWEAVEDLLPPWVRVVPSFDHQQVLIPDHGVRLILWSGHRSAVRGLNARGAWLDEIVAFPNGGKVLYQNLRRALRAPGKTPARCVVTTTPPESSDHWLLDLLARPTTRVTRGTARDAARYLPDGVISKTNIEDWYAEDTRESRRENDGAFIFGADGALFSPENLDAHRVEPGDVPPLAIVVVSVDPSLGNTAESDPVGCAVLGFASGHGYLLASFSQRLSPDEWPRRALDLGDEHHASQYLVEATGGGQTGEALLRGAAKYTHRSNRNIRQVKAVGSKAFRAGPVALAASAGRFHVVGHQPDFEREATSWVPGANFSPGALDALSHAWAVVTFNGKGSRL